MSRVCVAAAENPKACLTCTRGECVYNEEHRIQKKLLRELAKREKSVNGASRRLIQHDGKSQSLQAWARELGVDYMTLYMRMRRGASVEEAFSKKYQPHRRGKKRMDLDSLAAEIHAAAVAKGFWEAFDAEDRNLACAFTEIGEAVQANRLGMPLAEIERDGAKPEGVGVELADFCMRLLDYAEYRGAVLRPLVVTGQKHCSLPHLALKLYKTTAFMVHKVAGKQASINRVSDCVETMIADVAEWLNAQGCSLIDLIQIKMEYNKTRPALHGKRY